MSKFKCTITLLVGGLVLCLVARAEARRVPPTRSDGYRSNGARNDVTVPYLTSGRSTFMSGSVAPRIYSSPILDYPRDPGAKPVFNLIFWGAVQAFGDRSNGAVPYR
jgi:hypothetical protein